MKDLMEVIRTMYCTTQQEEETPWKEAGNYV